MTRPTLLDTGPLIAVLDRRDAHHVWAWNQFDAIDPPLLTCEAVLTEACFLARRVPHGVEAVLDMLRRGTVAVDFSAAADVEALLGLVKRYANVPMSFADACLVRMAESRQEAQVLTLDRDFLI